MYVWIVSCLILLKSLSREVGLPESVRSFRKWHFWRKYEVCYMVVIQILEDCLSICTIHAERYGELSQPISRLEMVSFRLFNIKILHLFFYIIFFLYRFHVRIYFELLFSSITTPKCQLRQNPWALQSEMYETKRNIKGNSK